MNNKLARLKREICYKGSLFKYENTIDKIIVSIHDAGCSISCCDICETSSIEKSIVGEFKAHIRIGFKGAKEKPIHYIWDILHEFGHHMSGLPNGKERTIERETQAWAFGFKLLKKYPELLEKLEDFEKYREICLRTYGKLETRAYSRSIRRGKR